MDWRDYCVEELAKHRCFISAMHKLRFIEMYEFAVKEPFFSKGMCKCLFLAAWNQKDTIKMEEILEKMSKMTEVDPEMVLGTWEESLHRVSGNERAVYELARDFLLEPGQTPDESCLVRLSKAWIPMGDCALQVSSLLDNMK